MEPVQSRERVPDFSSPLKRGGSRATGDVNEGKTVFDPSLHTERQMP